MDCSVEWRVGPHVAPTAFEGRVSGRTAISLGKLAAFSPQASRACVEGLTICPACAARCHGHLLHAAARLLHRSLRLLKPP